MNGLADDSDIPMIELDRTPALNPFVILYNMHGRPIERADEYRYWIAYCDEKVALNAKARPAGTRR